MKKEDEFINEQLSEVETHIGGILAECATQAVPDSLSLWPSIHSRLEARQRRSSGAPKVFRGSLRWAFLSLILVVALTATAYAGSPVVRKLFQQMWPGANESGLVQNINLSQTINGVTVTLENAYADANRIFVGFTVKDTAKRYIPHQMKLTDATGTEFPGQLGMGVGGQSDILGMELPPGEGSSIWQFDAAAVKGMPQELNLSFETYFSPMTKHAGPRIGPFTFDFTMPFVAGQVIWVDQTAEADGVLVTLEKVVITPSETRAFIRIDSPEAEKDWRPIIALELPNGTSKGFALSSHLDGRTRAYSFLGDFSDQHGEWILKVTELVSFDVPPIEEIQERKIVELTESQMKRTRLTGPWVFPLEVP